MVLLVGEDITKSYTERKLLDHAGFHIDSGDRIGLIGVNGTGKTTLLRIIAGEEGMESGSIVKAKGLRIGYLLQNPELKEDDTILGQCLEGVTGEAKEFECKTILTKLGLCEYDAKIGTLSGGQKKRVALASALIHDVDLLILDEPTNHIDNDMVVWLENYLASYKGALLMVTHDRYFLDRVTNQIWEVDKGSVYSYPCAYSKFLELKAEREEMTAAWERKRQNLIQKELDWIRQGPCGRGTKSQYRIDRLKQLQSQQVDLSKSNVDMNSVSSRLGRKIIEIDQISKSYGDKTLIQDFSYRVLKDDRIGIIGSNGIGKSTLLKIVMGQTEPDSGRVEIGETVRIGYFSQQCEQMDPSKRPIDYIKEESNSIETPDGFLSASQMLERFLFVSELQYTTIGRLSGGERRRLYLLKILMTAPNVLILDEPTNDLDIETLTILEDYLQGFQGPVIIVSHDRYFLDKLAGRIFSFEDGGIRSYMGGYTDWTIQREAEAAPGLAEKTQKSKQGKGAGGKTSDGRKSDSNEPAGNFSDSKTGGRPVKLKFTYREAKEFDSIDEEIATLEEKVEQLSLAMNQNAADFVRLQELAAEKEAAEQQLAERMERWVYLNELHEKIVGEQ